MTIRNLNYLFRPKSVALFGATDRPNTVGAIVMQNLLHGGFSGPIMPVNPNCNAVLGVLAYPDVKSLPVTPDLAVICTSPTTIPSLVRELGERGTRAAVVLTGGLSRTPYEKDKQVAQAMLEAARPYLFRILGANSLGYLIPGIGLNASCAHLPATSGKIAFVSQSAALCTAVLDWARPKGIGFSHFISLGDSDDVNVADVLDYLGNTAAAHSILLYIESIEGRRGFMSAARAAARNKPVMVIKSGRVTESVKAAASHVGALAGADAVYDSAFRRAGLLRAHDIEELFAAVETLARSRPARQGARLAIVTNGSGFGRMAVDDLIEGGGRLANLSEKTLSALDSVLPPAWSKSNPIDILVDVPSERYMEVLKVLFSATEVDTILCIHAPAAMSSATNIARAIVELAAECKPSILTCWVGGEAVDPARRIFNAAGLQTYDAPKQAIQAFLHMIRYRRNQELLMQTPPEAPSVFTPATADARLVVESVLASNRRNMSEPEANAVLSAYGVPTVETYSAHSVKEAVKIADKIAGPVALKIFSPELNHKADVGGVALDLNGRVEIEKAAYEMLARVESSHPEVKLEGFTVQRMVRRPGAEKLIVGVTNDPVFGPVIFFGQGGSAVEVIGDRSMALPPLNMILARDMISRTRVFKLLLGYRNHPAVNIDAICLTLMQVSQLIIDIPEIVELDINPLFADSNGVLAQGARIKIAAAESQGANRLAIRPYPQHLEETLVLKNNTEVLLRPIRPEDEPAHQQFFSRLAKEDIRYRFFNQIGELRHSEMARYTQIDYDREMAFIATVRGDQRQRETLGVVRTFTDPDNEYTEFALIVRSDCKGLGLGRAMIDKMIRYCRSRGRSTMVGFVLEKNSAMLRLAKQFNFESQYDHENAFYRLTLKL
jgi:acetyltransferase